jgi:cholest-4-en-3-one 26-monooxygenase
MNTRAGVETVDLTDPATWEAGVPHDVFDAMRREAPVSWHERPTGNYWSLTRHADIAAVSRDQTSFTSHKGIYYPPIPELASLQTDMLVFLDPPRHTQLRGLVSKSFTPKVVQKLDGWIREVARDVISGLQDKDEFDFVAEVASEVPAQVIASIMGVADEDRPRFKEWAVGIFGRETPGGQERFVEANIAIAQWTMELREEKRKNPSEDLTTALIDAHDDEGKPITDGEYQQFIWLLVMAGYETTHNAIGHSMRLMLEEPYVDQRVRDCARSGDLKPCVEELLRVVSPINHFARHALCDLEIGGQSVAKGDFVILWYPAGNRDPSVFEKPHEFIPTRSPNPHVTFGGGGPHHCLGKHIARLELEIFFDELVRSGLEFRLAGTPVRGRSCMANQLLQLPVARA